VRGNVCRTYRCVKRGDRTRSQQRTRLVRTLEFEQRSGTHQAPYVTEGRGTEVPGPWTSKMGAPTHSIETLLQDVQRLLATKQVAAARERCAELGTTAPSDPRVWKLAAEIASRSNKPTEALDHLRRAVACAPEDTALLIQSAQYLLRWGRRRDALTVVAQAEGHDVRRPELLDAIGTLLTHAEEPGRALPFFVRAVAAAPRNAEFRYNLAMAQRMVGALEAAESNLDDVIAARPTDGEAYGARSALRKQTRDRNHVNELEGALERLKGQRAAFAVAFALAKELEDLQEYARSFSYLHAACQTYRASLRYDVTDDIAVLDSLRTSHTAERFAAHRPGYETSECIFIIGLPRSGTTLVERILGSHSQVYSAGELNAFPSVAVESVTERAGGPVNKLAFVEATLDLDFGQLGRAYLEATRPRTGHTPRFTDKLPLNYLYGGLIHAALPQARFLALRRHPMDSCYAMYKTLFAAAYPFTYELMDLARYYVAWDRLMRHWEAVIGDAWLPVNYEELVADQKGVSRRIVAHCGLDWEDRCLDFHNSSVAVTTASAVQVRQPLYADSVGKWRAYARELEPLARYLESNGIVID
jgi:thioredoxin-like negative regulator of GroEL